MRERGGRASFSLVLPLSSCSSPLSRLLDIGVCVIFSLSVYVALTNILAYWEKRERGLPLSRCIVQGCCQQIKTQSSTAHHTRGISSLFFCMLFTDIPEGGLQVVKESDLSVQKRKSRCTRLTRTLSRGLLEQSPGESSITSKEHTQMGPRRGYPGWAGGGLYSPGSRSWRVETTPHFFTGGHMLFAAHAEAARQSLCCE